MKFGIRSEDFALLEKLILSPLRAQGARVWIFGSRATGKNREFSDVDLMYEMPPSRTLPSGFLFQIKSELEDSRFSLMLDLVERSSLASSYRQQVEQEKIELVTETGH